MGYIGNKPTAVPLTSADIQDGVITAADLGANSVDSSELVDNSVTLAKMAGLARGKLIYGDASGDPAALAVGGADEVLTHDGTDFDWAAAGGFDVSSITGATALGATPASTDEFVLSDAGVLKRVDFSYMSNTPAFMARMGSGQSVDNGTWTKLEFDTEIFDSDGKYDSSTNYRFTPTVAGKYFCSFSFSTGWIDSNGLDDAEYATGIYYKNGAMISPDMGLTRSYSPAADQLVTVANSMIIELDADDYVEIYMLHNEGASIEIPNERNHFSAFKLIGA